MTTKTGSDGWTCEYPVGIEEFAPGDHWARDSDYEITEICRTTEGYTLKFAGTADITVRPGETFYRYTPPPKNPARDELIAIRDQAQALVDRATTWLACNASC